MRYPFHLNIGPADSPKELVNMLSGVRSLNNGGSKKILAWDKKIMTL